MPTRKLLDRLKVWPLPALAAWALAWGLFALFLALGVHAIYAIATASAVGVACSLWAHTWWRRLLIAGGFPLSLILSLPNLHHQEGWIDVPAWGWLLPLFFLLLVYPLNAWRDAPLFPTPADALDEMPQHAPLIEGAWVLDAGCGLGHGLQALHRAYPEVVLHGLEWSWPLRLLCALRCRFARVRQGDIWKTPWLHYDMVYLFQRPESMPRAVEKATQELRPGSWMVSLDFEATQLQPTAQYRTPGGKMVWLYQAPFVAASGD